MAITPKQNLPFVSKLLKNHQQLWDKQNIWRTTGESLRHYIRPNDTEINTIDQTEGRERFDRVYSSTAVIAAPRLASHLTANVTPSKLQWFNYEAPTEDVQDLTSDDRDWLQDEALKIFKSIQSSNFGGEILKFWLEATVYGTGAIQSMEHPKLGGEFLFHTIPYGEYVMDEGEDGLVSRFDREFRWTLDKIVQKWGMDNISPNWQRDFEHNPFQLKQLVQMIKPSQKEDHQFGVPSNRPWAFYVMDMQNKHILEASGFQEHPVHVGRWFQAAGEDLGRGPGHDVLADIRSDNEIARLGLNNLAISVYPPMIAKHEGVLGQPVLRPAALNWVMEQGDLVPWQNAARLDLQQYGQQLLKLSIDRAFYQDLINITQNQPQGKTPISATQINANIDIMLPIIGPFLAKIEHEMMIPMLNRLNGIKQRAGKVTDLPPGLLAMLQAAGGLLGLQIKGPIARAIKKQQADAVDAVITRFNSVSAVWPEFVDKVNVDRVGKIWVDAENAPIEMLNTEDEEQAIRDQRAKAKEQAQENQDLLDASQVAKNTSGIPQEA